jgi:DNA-binding NarL/FixJ family response regulator
MVTHTKPRALVIGNYRGRESIIQALRGSPFEIVEATEGRRGLKHVIEDSPNVVIISGSTGEAGRLNLLRAIRCLTSAPILVIGSGRETCANEFLLHGASGFVPYCRRFDMTPVYISTLLSRN